MSGKTVLITGATGFLGRKLVNIFINRGYNIVATGYSETGIKEFERAMGKDIPLYAVDIGSHYSMIKNIINKHSVDYIIHAAALKHVGICEDNPSRAIQTNIVGSQNIIKAAIECGVENAIAISTDKSIKPLCTYGMTKKLMEEMFLENGFGVFQGVNFLFSCESVLDIWDKLRVVSKPLLVNLEAVRYFSTIDDVCNTVVSSIDAKKRFSVGECYKISISNLQKAFSEYHNYWNVNKYAPLAIEKVEEELPLKNIKIKEPSVKEAMALFAQHYGANK